MSAKEVWESIMRIHTGAGTFTAEQLDEYSIDIIEAALAAARTNTLETAAKVAHGDRCWGTADRIRGLK